MKNSLNTESVAQQLPSAIVLVLAKIIVAPTTATAVRSSLLLWGPKSWQIGMLCNLCSLDSMSHIFSVCKSGLPRAGNSTPWQASKWHCLAAIARDTLLISTQECKTWCSPHSSAGRRRHAALLNWALNQKRMPTTSVYLAFITLTM